MLTSFKELKDKFCVTKQAKTKTGRLYIRLDEKYAHCAFELSQIIKEQNKKRIIIELGKGERQTSLRKSGKQICGLIDLRSKTITDAFKNCNLIIKVYDDMIVVEGVSDNAYVGEIALAMASGDGCTTTHIEHCVEQINKQRPLTPQEKKKIAQGIQVATLFAGMGGLDYGFKQAGYDLIFALDKPFEKETQKNVNQYGKGACSVLEQYHIETYRKNVGSHIVAHDILSYPINKFPQADVFVAGIPCQELSSVSPNRNQFVMLPQFFNRFIEIIQHARKTCKVFIIENSNNLVNAGRQFLDQLKKELSWFHITENVVDAADFGSAQHRKRAIIIGSTAEPIVLTKPKFTFVRTVGKALADLDDSIPNQLDFTQPKEETVLRMSYVPEGGNGLDIPEALRTGKFANSYRRLNSQDKSCAIANVRKSCIMPPYANRTLSIRECLRLFDLPDSFICYGTLAAKQQMVANSVPYMLSKAIANTILNHFIKN